MGHPLAVVVQNPEGVLSIGEALLSRLAKPKGRLSVVLRKAFAVVVGIPKVVLRVGEALLKLPPATTIKAACV